MHRPNNNSRLPSHTRSIPPAGFVDRLFAVMIDSFILGSANALVVSLVPALKPALGFINVAYFYYFQIHRGATPGKMLLGLRVVNHTDLEAPTNKSILFRETVGRLVSVLSVVGYFLPLVNKDKRALHDIVAGTRVIREREGESSVGKMVAMGFGGLAVIVFSFIYVMLYTAVPLRYYAENLELVANVKIDGVNGSIMKGLRVDSVSFNNEKAKGQVNNLRFEYELKKLFSDEWLTINNIRIGGGKIELEATGNPLGLKKRKDEAAPQANAAGEEAPSAAGEAAKKRPGRNFAGILIKTVDITNLELDYAKKSNLKISRFFLQDMKVGRDKTFSWNQLHLESAGLRARSGKVEFNAKGDVSMSHSLELVAKAGFTPDIIKDIDVKVFVNRAGGQFTNMHINAFGGKLRAGTGAAQSYVLAFKDFTTSEFFKSKSLVKNVSVTVQGPDLRNIRIDGQFQIGDRVVPVESGAFRFAVGPRVYTGQINPLLWGMGLMGGKLPIQMSPEVAGDAIDPRQELALLAYGRSVQELGADDRGLVLANSEVSISSRDPRAMMEMLKGLKGRRPASGSGF